MGNRHFILLEYFIGQRMNATGTNLRTVYFATNEPLMNASFMLQIRCGRSRVVHSCFAGKVAYSRLALGPPIKISTTWLRRRNRGKTWSLQGLWP
ncbi:hypothetical protein [Phyllobacterium leguminum]|uniref:hypothetical protein n=1 Tax=Phyllobacterium leguminum TaxID=314237 RepID=UPI0011B57D49|nr:hypothetical protein [Phyllobacterium leguminum]